MINVVFMAPVMVMYHLVITPVSVIPATTPLTVMTNAQVILYILSSMHCIASYI